MLGLALFGPPSLSQAAETLRILWTNDTHAYLLPVYHREEGESGYLERARREGKLGGFAHIATLVNRLREQQPASTLLLDAGDTFHGTAVPLFGQGKPVVQVMNAMGYDAGSSVIVLLGRGRCRRRLLQYRQCHSPRQ